MCPFQTLLSGSLRSTLDPLDEYQDYEIFDALKRARLLPAEAPAPTDDDEVNVNVFEDLDTEVAEQGQNFSAGQRQLLCLARALLKQHPLILMDEATSSVDFETDTVITATIAEEFKNSSLLVIGARGPSSPLSKC
jgi:ABC-type multidrug transport system fused ATPase/permease subunit